MSSTEFSLSIKREEFSYNHLINNHKNHIELEPFGLLCSIFSNETRLEFMKRDDEEVNKIFLSKK